MTAKCKCSAKTPDMYGVPNILPCARSATVERDGKRFCWQHDPERMEADAEKRLSIWQSIRQAEADRKAAMWKRRASNARLAKLVTPKLASLLCDLAAGCDHSAWLAAEKGWAMAARIRAALGETDG